MRRLLFAAFVLSGCYGQSIGTADAPPVRSLDPALQNLTAEEIFSMAAQDWAVPRDLLVALAWTQSSFAPGDADHDEHGAAHGWMGLDDDQVALASALTGYPAAAIAEQREANIFAAAALLDDLRDHQAPRASTTVADVSWWDIVVDFQDLGEDWLNHQQALDVFRTLQDGFLVPTVSGDTVRLPSRTIEGLQDVDFIRPPSEDSSAFAGTVGYPGRARFTAAHSSNQSSRSGGTGAIRRVVLHTTEGSYAGAISWFRNPSSNVSAHYVVRKSDGEVTQMVSDDRKAWHACNNNNDTIGIEQEGAASNPATWTPALVDSSARLTAWLVTQYDIPIDRQHIVGHGEIQPASCAYRSDPGAHFPWEQFMAKVAAYAHGTSPAAEPDPVLPGGDTGLTPPTFPTPEVDFQSPRNGETVANPVVLRIGSKDVHHVEVWVGAERIAQNLLANPVHVGAVFSGNGPRTITARGYSAAGALVATDTITIDVRTVATKLRPVGEPLQGMTWKLSSEVESGPAPLNVRYYVDGRLLNDAGTGSPIATGEPWILEHSFEDSGSGRLLQARGFDDRDELVAEGFAYIDVQHDATASGEAILHVLPMEVTGTVMRFQSEATSNVAWMEYRVDGYLLTDMASGETRARPADFGLWYRFNAWGARTLEVRAYDASGALLDVHSQTIHVPAPDLSLTWARTSPMVYRFDAAAPAGTARVVIDIEGYVLTDRDTGLQYATGPGFVLNYHFNYAGYRAIRARAYDVAGNLIDTWTGMIQNY